MDFFVSLQAVRDYPFHKYWAGPIPSVEPQDYPVVPHSGEVRHLVGYRSDLLCRDTAIEAHRCAHGNRLHSYKERDQAF